MEKLSLLRKHVLICLLAATACQAQFVPFDEKDQIYEATLIEQQKPVVVPAIEKKKVQTKAVEEALDQLDLPTWLVPTVIVCISVAILIIVGCYIRARIKENKETKDRQAPYAIKDQTISLDMINLEPKSREGSIIMGQDNEIADACFENHPEQRKDRLKLNLPSKDFDSPDRTEPIWLEPSSCLKLSARAKEYALPSVDFGREDISGTRLTNKDDADMKVLDFTEGNEFDA